MNAVTPEEAVKIISSNQRVFVQGGVATPQLLVKAMSARANELRNVEVVHLHTEGDAPYANESMKDSFFVNSFFIGPNVRPSIKNGNAQYIPVFLSEIPNLFRRNILPLDVAMVQVSPPDKHGYCSLGVSVDTTIAAIEEAKYVIAQINPKMPRTFGDGLIHLDYFHAFCEIDEDLPELAIHPPNEVESAIGKHIAGLVEDGATLQMGIGGIPNAALKFLSNHKDLGIHTEMFSDGIIDLVNSGVINGKFKKKHPYKITSGFAMGTKRLYEFMDDNPEIVMLDIAYVNDSAVIRQNPKVTAINSAVEIDLSGQVCADSIGKTMYSGVGGQMDFIRGASLSAGGKPIIALGSATNQGLSKLVPTLKEGAGVVTTRAHVHYVVTEYGVADLYGKNLLQRARALTNVAHPDHREKLEQDTYERFGRI
ncbi:MAG: acetyl-CoA hydrolase/transferase family protein [Cytophagales bacterium]|nr:acetyl-CoA hydrolase/transferase family protein [Cytophagales bacterium]